MNNSIKTSFCHNSKESGNWIHRIRLALPGLQNNTADVDRLINGLKNHLNADRIDVDFQLVKRIPEILRESDYDVKCVVFKDRDRMILLSVAHAKDKTPAAGVAIDLGTSRIGVRLLELSTGSVIAESTFDNPQISAGPDILARIHFADQSRGVEKLNQLIINGLNHEIKRLTGLCKIQTDNIYAVALAGNTAMTHLFMGLNPRWIIREPYIPVVNSPGILKARDLGIKANQFARVLIFPNIGSYFGGDLIAGILFSGLHNSKDTSILVDVGTNAEVVLGDKNWLIGCAGAAGPALEGGVTKIGITARPGAIDKITVDPQTNEFVIHTIENKKPVGICGSGLIDLGAGLFLSRMLDIRGRFVPEKCGRKLFMQDSINHLTVVSPEESATGEALTISQTDMDSLIRSKAAMYTILETITSSVGVPLYDLSSFYVAGTFGSFIDPESAISIGMLPDIPVDRYKTIGNSSLEGATLALKSNNLIEEIFKIRDRITYFELNVNQEFMNRFSAAKFLPHTDTSCFPSVVRRA
jgi:uncharacterized 2Fe-2S/4Fe-4S cluster protein (DUF4445 family)